MGSVLVTAIAANRAAALPPEELPPEEPVTPPRR
jgi:hypothetical protein